MNAKSALHFVIVFQDTDYILTTSQNIHSIVTILILSYFSLGKKV